MVSLYFIGGIIIGILGIIGIYLGKTFDEVKKRPLCILAETTFHSRVFYQTLPTKSSRSLSIGRTTKSNPSTTSPHKALEGWQGCFCSLSITLRPCFYCFMVIRSKLNQICYNAYVYL